MEASFFAGRCLCLYFRLIRLARTGKYPEVRLCLTVR